MVTVVCPLCGQSAATASVMADEELKIEPAGNWAGGDALGRRNAVVAGDVAHRLVAVRCHRMDPCGWLSELCACQLRDLAKRARYRHPWQWAPTADEQRDALRHTYGDDPKIDTWGTGERLARLEVRRAVAPLPAA
jgi:hypothetical protein